MYLRDPADIGVGNDGFIGRYDHQRTWRGMVLADAELRRILSWFGQERTPY
ncbi:MAG: hypothetical protein U9R75_01245 [Candidatus Thermoplasmatota archaeon]|nr:hypothetical protein [Candidatus Thermoplasmatota archaeon]